MNLKNSSARINNSSEKNRLIYPNWEGVPSNIHAFCTTRIGGVSASPYDDGFGGGGNNLGDHVGDCPDAVLFNRSALELRLPSSVTFLSQVHGTAVVNASTACGKPVGDSVFSQQPKKICAVLTADCLPVLFADTGGRVVAAAHAGWRGLAAGVLQNTVIQMRSAGADKITAWMGPAIGPAEFEVGQDVLDAFLSCVKNPESYFRKKEEEGKYLADIYGLSRQILMDIGIERTYGGNFCTVTNQDLFYSYRRDGVTGRIASVIWIDDVQ